MSRTVLLKIHRTTDMTLPATAHPAGPHRPPHPGAGSPQRPHTSYSYDELYRLIGETITDPVNGNHSAEYQFDKVGNRTYSIINGVHTAYSYDNNDLLTQQGGVSYSYDANGNTLTETEDGQVTRYHYNAHNKLIEVEKPGLTARYGYNADGIRSHKTENGLTTHYVVDSNRDYAQVLAEVTNGTADVSYTYGDDLVSQTRGGTPSYYLYDGHGSTRALADASGSLTDSYDYDAFGVLLNSSGDTENAYRYTGEQLDRGLDQYYLRARYYDQGAGRFTQQDTWMGNSQDPITLHKYLYGNADPINHIDPTGNFSLANVGTAIRINGQLAAHSSSTLGLSMMNRLMFGRGRDIVKDQLKDAVVEQGFYPVTADIPKKRLIFSKGNPWSIRLSVRFATSASPPSLINKSEHSRSSVFCLISMSSGCNPPVNNRERQIQTSKGAVSNEPRFRAKRSPSIFTS